MLGVDILLDFAYYKDYFKKDNVILGIIFCAVIIKGLIWAFVIPPFQTPDEPVHFAYVQYMGETGKIPLVGKFPNGISIEENSFLNAVQENAIAFHSNVRYKNPKNEYKSLLDTHFSNQQRISSGSTPASGYPPLYYWLGSLVYRILQPYKIIVQFYGVRVLSVIIGSFVSGAAYYIGRKISPDNLFVGVSLAILTSFQPMFSMISSSINNDVLLDSAASICFAWIVKLITEKNVPSKKTLIFGGFIIGIGMLAKAEMLYVCAVAFTTLGVLLSRRHGFNIAVKSLVLLAITVIVIYGWWAVFSFLHYHSILGDMGFQPQGSHGSIITYIRANFLEEWGIHRQYVLWIKWYWATFGWLDTQFPQKWVYWSIFLIELTALASVLVHSFRNKLSDITIKIAAFSFLYFIGNIIFLYAVEIDYFTTFGNLMLQGRYLFTSLIPLSVIIVVGISRFFPQLLFKYISYSLTTLSVLFNIACVYLELNRYYGFHI